MPEHDSPAVDVMDRDDALRLAIDAIIHDPRRTPYGHHQHGRDRAIRALRKLRDDADETEREGARILVERDGSVREIVPR